MRVMTLRPVEVNGLGWNPDAVAEQVTELLRSLVLLEDNSAVFLAWMGLVRAHSIRGKKTHDDRLAAVMNGA